MITVSHLTKYYGNKTALNDVSFSIEAGETVGLLGPNGAGKSTTMNIITGNLSPSAGSVNIHGADILEDPAEAKKHLGYLPEIPPLYPDMTVEGYLKFVYGLKKCKLPREEHLKKISEATQIADVRHRLIKNLSKGYRQRVGVAQALIGDPETLILDEPTVGLDPKQILEMRELIQNQSKGRTIIISSHILSEIQLTCGRVIVLNEGKLVADDTPAELSGKLAGGNLTVRAVGSDNGVKTLLKAVEGIKEVIPLPADRPGQCAFRLQCDDTEEARFRVAKAFKNSDYLMIELSGVEMTLEKIFLTLTEHKGGKA